MKYLDFADDTHRHILVDRESGRYLGHVTSVLLEDQMTILAVYPMGHGRGQIVMKKSADGGLTWSSRLPVPKSWSTALQVPTIFSCTDPQGISRLLVFTGHYPIRCSLSEDNGNTWTEFHPIGDFGANVAMSDIITLRDGRYMAFFHDDGRFLCGDRQEVRLQLYQSFAPGLSKIELFRSVRSDDGVSWNNPSLDETSSYRPADVIWSSPELIYEASGGQRDAAAISDIYTTLSQDGGISWKAPVRITDNPPGYVAEAGAIRSPDGAQLALLLRDNSRRFNSFCMTSFDEGVTWTTPKEVSSALTGDRHTLRYAPDGRVLISFRDMAPKSPTKGDWVLWIGTFEDILLGRDGDYRIRLMKNTNGIDCGYSGLHIIRDGTIVATSYGHWDEGESPYIVCVRFTLDELETMTSQPVEYKAVLPSSCSGIAPARSLSSLVKFTEP